MRTQNLCVCWEPTKVDTFSETSQLPIKLVEVRVETVPASVMHVRYMPQSHVTLKIHKNDVIQKEMSLFNIPDAFKSWTYKCSSRLCAEILALQLEPLIQQKHARSEETRPLWVSEREGLLVRSPSGNECVTIKYLHF